jgi:hypothetical protein
MATPWPNTLVFKGNLRRALAAALFSFGALVAADAAEPREETAFGSNPGNLRMLSYVPAELAPTAPLIVVLHGCKQKAAAFARDAGWLALADRGKLALLHACLDLVDDVRRDFPTNGATTEPDRPLGSIASEQEVVGSAPLIDVMPNRPATTVPAVALPAVATPVESRGNGLTLEQSRHNYFNNWRRTQHTDNFVVFQCREQEH